MLKYFRPLEYPTISTVDYYSSEIFATCFTCIPIDKYMLVCKSDFKKPSTRWPMAGTSGLINS